MRPPPRLSWAGTILIDSFAESRWAPTRTHNNDPIRNKTQPTVRPTRTCSRSRAARDASRLQSFIGGVRPPPRTFLLGAGWSFGPQNAERLNSSSSARPSLPPSEAVRITPLGRSTTGAEVRLQPIRPSSRKALPRPSVAAPRMLACVPLGARLCCDREDNPQLMHSPIFFPCHYAIDKFLSRSNPVYSKRAAITPQSRFERLSGEGRTVSLTGRVMSGLGRERTRDGAHQFVGSGPDSGPR
jgi:hypothetical protein